MTGLGRFVVPYLLLLAVTACTAGPVQHGIPQASRPAVGLGPSVRLSEECKTPTFLVGCSQLASVGSTRFEIECSDVAGNEVTVGVRGRRPEYRATLSCPGDIILARQGFRQLLLTNGWVEQPSRPKEDRYVGSPGGPAAEHSVVIAFTIAGDKVTAAVTLLGPVVTS